MRPAVLTAALVAAAVLVLLAPAALAHTDLADRDPGAGQTVERLPRIRLTFAAPLNEEAPRAIRLLGPRGQRWDTGQARIDGQVLLVEVSDRLPARGEYTVRWCAVAADGHPRAGAYKFTYTGPTSPAARPRATSAESTCFAPGSASTAATITGWAILGVLAAAVLFLIATVLRRRVRVRSTKPSSQ